MIDQEQPTYETAWNDLRNRQRLFFLAWLGGFAVVVLLSTVKSFPQWIPLTAWLAAFLYTGARWSFFLCPRCGKPFFKPNKWLIDQTRQTCPHCGLQKYAAEYIGNIAMTPNASHEPNPAYIAAWNDLRNRQRWFFVAWLGGFFGSAAIGLTKIVPSWIAPIFWFTAFFYTGNRWSAFPCPRCEKPFFRPNNWTVNQLRSTCPHCGLKKYAQTDADEETRYLRMYEQ